MRPTTVAHAQSATSSLNADQLPHGLPMFGVTLTIAAIRADLQVFGVLGSRSAPRLVLHDVLVHPEQFDDLALPAGTVALLQTHGQCWSMRPHPTAHTRAGRVMAIQQIAGEAHFDLVRAGQHADRIRLLDCHGKLISEHDLRRLRSVDQEVVALIGAALATQFDDEALSAVLARAYPGVTSLIRETRPFPRMFPSDRVSREGRAVEVWVRDVQSGL